MVAWHLTTSPQRAADFQRRQSVNRARSRWPTTAVVVFGAPARLALAVRDSSGTGPYRRPARPRPLQRGNRELRPPRCRQANCLRDRRPVAAAAALPGGSLPGVSHPPRFLVRPSTAATMRHGIGAAEEASSRFGRALVPSLSDREADPVLPGVLAVSCEIFEDGPSVLPATPATVRPRPSPSAGERRRI